MIVKTIIAALSIVLAVVAFAEQAWAESLTNIAANIIAPIIGVTEIVHVICTIAGVGVLAGALVKFSQHRRNPNEVPISTPFIMILLGIALITIIFIPLPKT